MFIHYEKGERLLANTEWTPARKRAFIIAVLRQGTGRWPPKYLVVNEAKTEKKINKKTGRLAQHFKCNSCQEEFTQKDVQVDHIIPVIDPVIGFTDWNDYIENLFCGKENLQLLCKPCHAKKTLEERGVKNGSVSSSKNKRRSSKV